MIFADGPRAGELVAIARCFQFVGPEEVDATRPDLVDHLIELAQQNDPGERIWMPGDEVVAYEFIDFVGDGELHWETGPAEFLARKNLEAVSAHLYRRSDADGLYYLVDGGCVEVSPGIWTIIGAVA